MVVKTYTPSIAEVLKKVNNAKTKDKKIAILKRNMIPRFFKNDYQIFF